MPWTRYFISIRHSPQFFPIYAQRCQQPERHRNERPSILWGCQDLLQQHLCRQQSLASLDVWEIRLPWNGPSVENQWRKKRNGVRNRSSAKSGTGLKISHAISVFVGSEIVHVNPHGHSHCCHFDKQWEWFMYKCSGIIKVFLTAFDVAQNWNSAWYRNTLLTCCMWAWRILTLNPSVWKVDPTRRTAAIELQKTRHGPDDPCSVVIRYA